MKVKRIIEGSGGLNKPVDCNKHDYIEVACMHQYELLITLKDGHTIEATAVTTETKANKMEYFIVEASDTIFEISMSELSIIKTVSKVASFDSVRFE